MSAPLARSPLSGALPLLGLAALFSLASAADAQVRDASIVGRVIKAGTEEPVQGAEIRLLDTSHRAVSKESGLFRLSEVPAGHHTLTVHYLGLQSEEFPVQVAPRETLSVTFRLETKVLPVAELIVTVDQTAPVSKLTGFYRRSQNGPGYFLTRADIEAMPATRTTDLLRRVPGLDIGKRTRAGRTPVTMGRRTGCFPRFYLDGAFASYFNVDNLQPRDIAGIEVYRGNSEVPIRFKHGDRCGVIVVWTRDPGNVQDFR